MTSQGFTHLHLHTQYSLLDGAIRMDELAPTIKEKGMNSVAVTDHGNMYGALHFHKQAKKHGVKPIFGCEAYVAPDRKDRTARESAHLVLLAKDNEGFKNLTYLISMGFMEGFYYNPRIDKELLRKHSKGLYALSACLGGVVNKCFLKSGDSAAAEVAREYKDIFEPGHFFLEVQSNGYVEQERANQALLEIGRTFDIPMVATADSHYLRPQDSSAHEILMCIGQSRSLSEYRAKMQHSDELFVKSPEDMYQAFARICPEAVENAARIAQNCNVELNLNQTLLPTYGVPEGYTPASYLEKVAVGGLQRRISEALYPIDEKAYHERLQHELAIILKMGFAGYFLIVWDFIAYAKNQTIPVGPGRGSGAGSLVAWSLRITDLDPIPYDLIFERFLNPDRVSMPDFDIDFCQERRGEVLKYVAQKYGASNVGQIVTYSQLSAKSVIKDVGRVMNLPFAEVNALTKLIPGLIDGKKVSIDQALELEPKLRAIQKEKPVYADVINIARALEGLNRQTGMHAAGIVIGDKPLWEYVPVCRGKEGELITQYAKDEVEEAGLVKFDFLGLKTLTVIANAEKLVRARVPDFNIEHAPLADPKVYKLMASGNTDGIFQIESSGFTDLIKRIKPDCFEDIVAAGALYRPGPLDAGMVDDYVARKHGRKSVTYPHPCLEPVLNTTYGVMVYQEQIMRIAVDLSGFTIGEADTLRKAMGKKKADVMAKMRDQFVQGAFSKSGMDKVKAEELFGQIEQFAGYCFNKSHSAAYALITYRTAYLKTYYPVEFMAALLSTEMHNRDNVVRYIGSAKEHGIAILPPNVNLSDRDFAVVPSAKGQLEILFGLGAVKGIGDAAIDAIIMARKQHSFTSLYNFCEQVDLKKVNRRVLEALIKSGAMESFGRSRAQLMTAIDRALDAGQAAQKDRACGQISLFAALSPTTAQQAQEIYVEDVEWTTKQLLQYEKESLGFYITGHPLDAYAAQLPRLCSITTDKLPSVATGFGNEVSLGCVISELRERPLKDGSGRMAFLAVEDKYGSCEVIVFSKVFAEYEALLRGDDPVVVYGSVMLEGEEDEAKQAKIRATRFESLADLRTKKVTNLLVKLNVEKAERKILEQLKAIFAQHKGSVPVTLRIESAGKFESTIALPESLRVAAKEELFAKVERLLGRDVWVMN
jgi:DNA polymerase III subunit alpha